MAFAEGTLVSIPNGEKVIESIQIREFVEARYAGNTWKDSAVDFIGGLPQGDILLLLIVYGNNEKIIVTQDQLFMTSKKVLKQGKDLIPGKCILMDKSGDPIEILEITESIVTLGVYNLATSMQPTKNTDGHLLLCNGIVVGDYALQLGLNS